jgi:hypothetical protein
VLDLAGPPQRVHSIAVSGPQMLPVRVTPSRAHLC